MQLFGDPSRPLQSPADDDYSSHSNFHLHSQLAGGAKKQLIQCRYGLHCGDMHDPVHCARFIHDSHSPYPPSKNQYRRRPPCKYGVACYRQNPEHQQQYSHPDNDEHKDFSSSPHQNKSSSSSPPKPISTFDSVFVYDEAYVRFLVSKAEKRNRAHHKAKKASASPGMLDGGKFPDPLSADEIKKQKELGPQSFRGFFGLIPFVEEHPRHCFEMMMENEKRLCGEYSVMYHSYSFTALLYEVQASVAAVLFRFKASFGSLPRLQMEPFCKIPNAVELQRLYGATRSDHDLKFRAVGICASTTLLGPDPEAPPTKCFTAGYSCSNVRFLDVLKELLTSCSVPFDQVDKVAGQIVTLSEKYGLDGRMFGGRGCISGRSGHLLQIFIRRELVDLYAYSSLPFGTTDPSRHPIGNHFNSVGPISGQVRICAHPLIFMRAKLVKMFLYSADATFHKQRAEFQTKLVELLDDIIGRKAVRKIAAEGLCGGSLPSWFEPDDQRRKVKCHNKYS